MASMKGTLAKSGAGGGLRSCDPNDVAGVRRAFVGRRSGAADNARPVHGDPLPSPTALRAPPATRRTDRGGARTGRRDRRGARRLRERDRKIRKPQPSRRPREKSNSTGAIGAANSSSAVSGRFPCRRRRSFRISPGSSTPIIPTSPIWTQFAPWLPRISLPIWRSPPLSQRDSGS